MKSYNIISYYIVSYHVYNFKDPDPQHPAFYDACRLRSMKILSSLHPPPMGWGAGRPLPATGGGRGKISYIYIYT